MTQSPDQNPTLAQEVERYRQEIAWVLKPGSLRGAGPSTTPELPRASGGGLAWAYLQLHRSAAMCWSLLQ